MNESKFDSEIKRILSGAEAPVSPSAWEGISSRLPAKRHVLPLWPYMAAAGIAAALAAGVFLFKPGAAPEKDATADVIISQEIPSISQQIEAAAENSAVAKTEPLGGRGTARSVRSVPGNADLAAPTEVSAQSVPGNADLAAPTEVSKASVPGNADLAAPTEVSTASVPGNTALAAPTEVSEASVPGNAALAAPTEAAATEKQAVTQSGSDDDRLLALLAANEEKPSRRRFLLTASANLQAAGRQTTAGRTIMRAPSAKPEKAGFTRGVTREDPEYHFSIPVTAGIGLRYNFTKRWSIGSGLQYTNMSRSFTGDYTEYQDDGDVFSLENTDINNMQHWLGIPLNVYYEILPDSKWSVHCFAGADVEYLLQNHYLVHTSGNDIHVSESGHGLQFSVGAGIGVEYRLTPKFGLFLDPSIRYYFDNHQPRSVRTIQPLRMDFQAGVRFTL